MVQAGDLLTSEIFYNPILAVRGWALQQHEELLSKEMSKLIDSGSILNTNILN